MTGPQHTHVDAVRTGQKPGLPADISDALHRAIRETVFLETTRRLSSQKQRKRRHEDAVDGFINSLLSADSFDTSAALYALEGLSQNGVDMVALFENCATTLGSYWEYDNNDFFEVSVATSRLQTVLRRYCLSIRPATPSHRPYDALIAPIPGEQHVFAATLLELIVRLQGWNASLIYPRDHEELAEQIQTGGFDVVCLSWTTVALTETLFTLNKTLEAIPEGSRPKIMAGGLAAKKREKWLVRVGVDYVADSAREAVDAVNRAFNTDQKFAEFGRAQTGTIGDSRRSAH